MDTYDKMVNTVSITNEELQLRSITIMSEVVKALDVDVSYTDHIKMRNVELYTSLSPVRITFDRERDDPGEFSINVIPWDENHIKLHSDAGNQIVVLGDTVALGHGHVVFVPTDRYGPDFFGQEIQIQKQPVSWTAGVVINNLHITHDKQILRLAVNDFNAQRAADIVNMLVIKYNEAAIREKNRKLIFENEETGVRYFWVKPSDVAIYVERGAADIGVAGKDILEEYRPNVYELLDLKTGVCKMMVAAKSDFHDDHSKTLRVATKFVNIARNYYAGKSRDIDIIKLNGSIEIAPILGLSDVIVDIVETGTTLKENDLQVYEDIFPISEYCQPVILHK